MNWGIPMLVLAATVVANVFAVGALQRRLHQHMEATYQYRHTFMSRTEQLRNDVDALQARLDPPAGSTSPVGDDAGPGGAST